MNSTPTPNPLESNDGLTTPADERLAETHKQITRANEELTRLSEQLARMERDAAAPAPAQPAPPSVGPSPAASEPGPASSGPRSRSPRRMPGFRALAALSLAACIVVAALALQSSYGRGVKQVVARWVPQLAATPSLPPDHPPVAAQPAPPTVQVAAADAAPPQATPPVQTAPPQEAASAANTALADQAQLLQTIARNLENVERSIEQLKADQQQTARTSSKAIEDLRASQEEIKRTLAKVSEPKPLPLPTPPTPAPSVRKPERPSQPPYARARPPMPREWLYDDW